MTIAILILAISFAIFWLVFFKFKLLRLTPAWGIVFGFFVLHLCLMFIIGLSFVTPNSANATVVQHTIQLIPRLPEPTLVTAVLVEENMPVKKGQPLFQFDRRPYEYKVQQLEAQLAEARQNVLVLQSDVGAATYAVKMLLDDPEQSKFPIGAQGSAAIYTSGEHGAWAALRKISIRAHSWLNWLYPINF